MRDSAHIVIVGGGFAGMQLARELEVLLAPRHKILLVSKESYITFNPMLAEVVGASVFPEQVVAPLRQVVSRTRFVMAEATRLDAAARELHCDTLDGPRVIHYEHIVFAFGSRANLDLLPGVREHAMPLKLVGDALHIRNMVLRRLARLELAESAEERRRLARFVVIGGGFSGVEVAGELHDFLHGALPYYPRVDPQSLRVTVLHNGERLLPELPPRLGEATQHSFECRGIEVRLGLQARRVTARGVELGTGELVEAASVICTIGTEPHPLAMRLGLPLERGRIRTRPDMSVDGAGGIWAIGDCAWVPNARDDAICPPTAQFAIQQARQLARNLVGALAGRPTQAFSYRPRGMMATIGHRRGVADVMGVRVSGFVAWLLWRAFYLALMPTLGRKLRIFVEWTWGMLFRADITHLRFTRTGEPDTLPAALNHAGLGEPGMGRPEMGQPVAEPQADSI